MANHKSAEKRMIQSRKRRVLNKSQKSAMKTQIKKFLDALKTPDAKLGEMLSQTYKKVDQVAAKGVIHKNTADRIKSRLTLRMNKAVAQKG